MVSDSSMISTQVSNGSNLIQGEIISAFIHDQTIQWGTPDTQTAFSLSSILVFCSCKYFNKETVATGFGCSHIIGQLRRLLHLTA